MYCFISEFILTNPDGYGSGISTDDIIYFLLGIIDTVAVVAVNRRLEEISVIQEVAGLGIVTSKVVAEICKVIGGTELCILQIEKSVYVDDDEADSVEVANVFAEAFEDGHSQQNFAEAASPEGFILDDAAIIQVIPPFILSAPSSTPLDVPSEVPSFHPKVELLLQAHRLFPPKYLPFAQV